MTGGYQHCYFVFFSALLERIDSTWGKLVLLLFSCLPWGDVVSGI